ncbi:MAG: hypothetical protein BGP13_13445 [Sphingobacteriales bacterium 40-81]|nr:MAG: hypothetical protein BGP13_13445 [Sphingobacteriales bacterium 40-81]
MHIIRYIFLVPVFFILVTLLFVWVNRRRRAMPVVWLAPALIAKVFAGMLYGYLYAHYFPVSDSWMYFRESLIDYKILLNNPTEFFSVHANTGSITDFFSNAPDAFWSNAGENLLIKLLAILNVFTGGNYYLTSILFNCFTFWGLYLFYSLAHKYFPGKGSLLIMFIFFLPSCLFWNSGMDKDGLLIFFAGTCMFYFDKCITLKGDVRSGVICLFSFAGLLLMRNLTAITFLPAILAWLLSFRKRRNAYLYFAGVYAVCIVLFFWSARFPDSAYNLPLKFAEKQHQFLSLEGKSKLQLTPLEPTVASYVKVLPEALNHVFWRPYITEIKSPFHLLSFAENLAVIVIIVLVIWITQKRTALILHHPFSMFLLTLALVNLLSIGYLVPFSGAIMRYKAFYVVCLLLPFINCIKTTPGKSAELYI